MDQPEVVGVCRKSTSPALLVEAIDIAVRGGMLSGPQFPRSSSPPDVPLIREFFGKGRGSTAARLAGAISR
ncbi:MAG TPA: hypothetical protein VFX25_32045 [Streptosporangiaceae bacterium]|nr:hypothetical protein [Streptosporangiaceae bacterium]